MKTTSVAGFLLGFLSETIVIQQVILVFSIYPFSKCSFCVKSICKNYYLCLLHTNIYDIQLLLMKL